MHLSPIKGKKTRIYLQKWLDYLLLMTSYLGTITTDSHHTCIKMCLREMHTATENRRSGLLFVLEKCKKNLRGGGTPALGRPRVYISLCFLRLTFACQKYLKEISFILFARAVCPLSGPLMKHWCMERIPPRVTCKCFKERKRKRCLLGICMYTTRVDVVVLGGANQFKS